MKKRHLKKQVKTSILVGITLVLFVSLIGVLLSYILNRNENPTVDKEFIEGEKFTFVPVEEYDVSLVMVGDALLHGAVYVDAQTGSNSYDFSPMLENMKPVISNYDLAFYNQETILGGTALGLSTYPQFNSPQEFGDNMLDVGFNLVSLANNHTLDRGEEAIMASHDYWSNKSAITAGSYISEEERNTPKIFEKNGITFALLAYTYGTNGIPIPEGKDYLVNVYTEQMLKDDIAKVRESADVVIVSMHWGIEYTHDPTDEQYAYAQILSDCGVDLVIGSHPHVIQPVDYVGDTLVYYSLGNFISAQDGIERTIGMIGAVDFHKEVRNGESTVEIRNPKADLVYTYYSNGYHNFKLYMFDELDDSILPDNKNLYNEYTSIITTFNHDITVGGIK